MFSNVKAQELSFNPKLPEKPEIESLVTEEMLKEYDDQTILDERFVEYNFDAKGEFQEIMYVHKIKYANSDEAIEQFNKIYIYLGQNNELLDYDARVILKNGTIKNLGKDALREGTDEDGDKYKYFAVSGIEKGSFIEYYHLIKRPPSVTGNSMILQDKKPTRVSRFRLAAPENLVFVFKANNGYTQPERDTVVKDVNVWKAETKEIGKSESEVFGNAGGNRMSMVYHLYENLATRKRNFYNYATVSQNVFERLNTEPSKGAAKKIKKFIESSEIKYASSKREKIMAIEHAIKSGFNYLEFSDPRLSDIEYILNNKVLNDYGAVYLFYQIFKTLGYETEIVLTSNRYNLRFDEKFESYAFLDKYLLYFPDSKEYLMPTAVFYRLGLLPPAYIHNHGLFIRTVSAGGIQTGAGKIKFIEALGSDKTSHEINCLVKVNESNDSLIVQSEQIYTGYYAQVYQPVFDYVESEKMKEFEESIVESISDNIKIKKINVEHKGGKYLMDKPLIIKATFTSGDLIETAGDKIIVKLGELIGPQVEMYQEEKRTHPVENDYNRCYVRQLTFEIPNGYKCTNAESTIINVTPFPDKSAYFTSEMKQEGNKIIVDVKEYYNRIFFSEEEFNNYRDVINAAANFNKVALILEKV